MFKKIAKKLNLKVKIVCYYAIQGIITYNKLAILSFII